MKQTLEAGARRSSSSHLPRLAVLKGAWLFGLAGVLLSPAGVAAETYQGVGFAGGGISGNDASGYAGAVVAMPGGALGRGLAVRASLNGGRYEYVSDGFEIDAQYRGAEAALVYQTSGTWGWANFSAGPRLTNLDLSPNDPGNDRRGTRVDLGLQSDGALELNDWRLNWLGSVTARDKAYLAQLAAGRLVHMSRQTRVGAEASIQGDERYTAFGAGSFASTQLVGNLEGRIAGGISDQEGRRARPYVTAGMTILF